MLSGMLPENLSSPKQDSQDPTSGADATLEVANPPLSL